MSIKLSEYQVKQIYDYYVKNGGLDLNKMLEMYCNDISDYVLFECQLEFRRDANYYHLGLLTTNQTNYVLLMFRRGFIISLGAINGKHSDVIADLNNIKFIHDKKHIQKYIINNGTITNLDYFEDNFTNFDKREFIAYDINKEY